MLLTTKQRSETSLFERVILLKRSLSAPRYYYDRKDCNYREIFVFSFFLFFFFFARVFTEARKSEISESNCREFYTRSAILEILSTPAGYSLFRWSIRVVLSVLFSSPFFLFEDKSAKRVEKRMDRMNNCFIRNSDNPARVILFVNDVRRIDDLRARKSCETGINRIIIYFGNCSGRYFSAEKIPSSFCIYLSPPSFHWSCMLQ